MADGGLLEEIIVVARLALVGRRVWQVAMSSVAELGGDQQMPWPPL
jgi:hypothetical protein